MQPTEFHEGDAVKLSLGTYQGSRGVFLRLREDVRWAEIRETDGSVRSHPVAWLALDNRSEGDSDRPARRATDE